MNALLWIVGGGVLMIAISLVGAITLLFRETTVDKMLLPLVALAAGSLIGSAFFHLIPAGLRQIQDPGIWLLVIAGFSTFFALEQLLHWHHGHSVSGGGKQPLTYLILVGDGLHNFIDGAAVASTFLIDIRIGVATWTAVALHEIPQELGDYAVLVHGGWPRARALLVNALSALTFLVGGLLTYAFRSSLDVSVLVPFAAGNFLYIGATDLVPEINKSGNLGGNMIHLAVFLVGVAFMYLASAIS